MPTTHEPLVTAQEVSKHLGLHVKTVYKMARDEKIPSVRVGRKRRFDLSAVLLTLETPPQERP